MKNIIKIISAALLLCLSYGLVDSSLTDFKLIKAGKGIYGEGTTGLGIAVIGLSVNNTIIIDKDANGARFNGTLTGGTATITNINSSLVKSTTVSANNYNVATGITYPDGSVQTSALVGAAVNNLTSSTNILIQSDTGIVGGKTITLKNGNTTAMTIDQNKVDIPLTVNTTLISAKTSAGMTIKSSSGSTIATMGGGGGTQIDFSGAGSFGGVLALNGAAHGDAALEVQASPTRKIFDGYNNSGSEVFSFDKVGNLWITGNITANAFIGDGSRLTNLPSVPTSSLALTANNALTANYSILASNATTASYSSLSNTANIAPWSGITGKPTTLAGYGITDAVITNNYTGNTTLNGRMVITSTSNIGSGLTIETTGFIALTGNAEAWDDLRVDSLTARTGASAPDLNSGFGGNANLYYQSFSQAGTQIVYFEVQMPHDWDGGQVDPHIHLTPATNLTGTINFILEYSYSDINGVFSTPSSTFNMQSVVSSPSQWKHIIATKGLINLPASAISTMLMCRLYRDNTVGTNMGGAVGLMSFDIHYKRNSLGSRSELTK